MHIHSICTGPLLTLHRAVCYGHADVAALCTYRRSFVRRCMFCSDGGWRHFGKYVCLSGFWITWACTKGSKGVPSVGSAKQLRKLAVGCFVSLSAADDLLPMVGFTSKLSLGRFTEVCHHIWLKPGKNNNFRGDLYAFVTTLVTKVTFHLQDHNGFQDSECCYDYYGHFCHHMCLVTKIAHLPSLL